MASLEISDSLDNSGCRVVGFLSMTDLLRGGGGAGGPSDCAFLFSGLLHVGDDGPLRFGLAFRLDSGDELEGGDIVARTTAVSDGLLAFGA